MANFLRELEVKKSISLTSTRFTNKGQANENRATVDVPLLRCGGQIDLNGVVIEGGHIAASNAHVAGAFTLRNARIDGIVNIQHTFVGGDLDLANSTAGSVLLVLSGIGGNFDCNQTGINRELWCNGLEIRGSLYLQNLSCSGNVSLRTVKVEGYFNVYQRSVQINAKVLDLREMNVGIFRFDRTDWNATTLKNSGFTYGSLEFGEGAGSDGSAGTDRDILSADLETLLLQEGSAHYDPQPYEQLSQNLARHGYPARARHVSILQQEAAAKQGGWPVYPWRLLGPIIGFGYTPIKALLPGMCLWFAGAIIGMTSNFGQGTSGSCPSFNSVMYSLDAMTPIIDLRQTKHWFPLAFWPTVYFWLHTIFGWLLTTLFVMGFTGTLNP